MRWSGGCKIGQMVDLAVLTAALVDNHLVTEATDLLGRLVAAALGWTEPPTTAEIRELLTELTQLEPQNAHCVMARSDAVLAGMGYWRRYPRPTHHPHADLEKLAVAPEFAGKGIGRSLLRELIGGARSAGIEQLTLDFRGDNHTAERLYRSEGFREYGRLSDFVAPGDGCRLDKVMHVIDLR